MLLINLSSCVYCGNEAQSRDHFIPLTCETNNDRNFEVPSCWQCNSTARNKYFPTFEEKASWLLTKAMQTKRARLLILSEIAPLVAERLRLHEAGKNTAPVVAVTKHGLCKMCGSLIANKRNKFYCGAICASRFGRDNARRRKIRQAVIG